MNAREIFDYVLPFENAITPHEVGFFNNKDYACQLTDGRLFTGEYMHGVTTVDLKLRRRVGRKSELFIGENSKDEAIEFINKVLS
jgi:hypothetical protein